MRVFKKNFAALYIFPRTLGRIEGCFKLSTNFRTYEKLVEVYWFIVASKKKRNVEMDMVFMVKLMKDHISASRLWEHASFNLPSTVLRQAVAETRTLSYFSAYLLYNPHRVFCIMPNENYNTFHSHSLFIQIRALRKFNLNACCCVKQYVNFETWWIQCIFFYNELIFFHSFYNSNRNVGC